MKIRNGFVTNSSATSFIISLKDKWDEKNFLNSLGATGESPMNKLFIDLFETVNDKKEDLLSAVHNCGEQKTVEEFLTEKGFGNETIAEVRSLLDKGRKVYFGYLSSDASTSVEVYFCCESFYENNANIYFNGNISGW